MSFVLLILGAVAIIGFGVYAIWFIDDKEE